jgi:hypothetical protein
MAGQLIISFLNQIYVHIKTEMLLWNLAGLEKKKKKKY